MTLLDHFLERADEHPDRTAVVAPDGTSLTYAQLAGRSQELAAAWSRQGIGPGDRVLVAVWPGIPLYAALAAIWRCGAVAVFPEASMGLAGFRHAAAAAQPKAILADPAVRWLARLLPETRRIRIALSPRASGTGMHRRHMAAATDAALISFTSGTTGRPKGMLRSHGLLLAQHEALAPIVAPGQEGETDLVAFPAFVLTCLGHGITAVLPAWNVRRHDRVSAEAIVRQARAAKVTRLLVPPVITARLAQDGVDGAVRRVLTGGGPVYPDVIRAFLARNPNVGLTIVYGSTEAEPVSHLDAATLSPDDFAGAARGGGLPVGRPVPQATVRIDGDEILVAGPHVNESYLDPAHDAGIKERIDGRIYHRTGDAGRLDPSGRLWLLGRLAATRAGIHPFAIETAARLQSGVTAAAVAPVDDRMILFVEGPRATLAPDFQARLDALGIMVRAIPTLPLDRRHRSKPDYVALAAIARRSL